jgi:hypothetical protein
VLSTAPPAVQVRPPSTPTSIDCFRTRKQSLTELMAAELERVLGSVPPQSDHFGSCMAKSRIPTMLWHWNQISAGGPSILMYILLALHVCRGKLCSIKQSLAF